MGTICYVYSVGSSTGIINVYMGIMCLNQNQSSIMCVYAQHCRGTGQNCGLELVNTIDVYCKNNYNMTSNINILQIQGLLMEI